MNKKLLNCILVLIMIFTCSLLSAQTICDQYGTAIMNGGEFILQNNVWGATTAQCITPVGTSGFTINTSEHSQTSVAAYPSIYKGCHWGSCTTNSNMPVQINKITSANFSYNVSTVRPAGNYNVAAEAWLSASADSSDGYSGGCELMIVLDYQNMYPAGSQVGTFNGHAVYYANIGWNFVTYVLTGRSSASGNLMDFINDCISRGYISSTSWYLHVFEAGFELMVGGAGLTANSFSFNVATGGTVPPTATRTSTAVTRTATATTLTRTATATRTSTTVTRTATATRTSTSVTRTATATTVTRTATATATSIATGCTCDVNCSSIVSIAPNFTKDGAGQFCYSATALGTYINSWNLTKLEINDVDYTNKWVSSATLPPKINGLYYVYYYSTVAYGHLEIMN